LNGRPARSVLPSLCAVCHGWGSGRICADCTRRFAAPVPRCERCAIEVPLGATTCGACLTEPPPFASTLTSTSYGYPWDRLIAAFKFHAALDLTDALVDLLLHAHAARPGTRPALLLPVPLSRQRLRERGYNQAWELARRLGRRLGCEADAELLLRIRDTPHQLALPPDRRAANVRGAFSVEPRRLRELRGRRITVVDDVMTSAATASEVARTLIAAGAERVDIWVVARTPHAVEAP
jgi:ComF family protein